MRQINAALLLYVAASSLALASAAGSDGGHGEGGKDEALLYCIDHEASYENRTNNPYAYNFCVVPESSYDVVLFGGVAVVLACLLQGKLASLMVLLIGATIMGIAWPFNLGALGNSLMIWLGMSPWQLFFYIFLPPLLLDAAVRIDWYMFRKVMVQVVTMAFLVVGAGCALMVPIMLYVLRLESSGWTWVHACMFGAIVASTDAVAIVSIMKTSGGPKRLRIILEGESLLNDASGLTLFEVFFHQVIIYASADGHGPHKPVGLVVLDVILAVVKMGLIGFALGYAFGFMTRMMLRVMRRFGAGRDQEVALTLAMAYLSYWVTASPCKGSGVVAVAVMGLYGAAKNKWGISVKAESEGTFDGFWETLAFVVNATVFAYSGAATVNFFIRSGMDLHRDNPTELWRSLWLLPIIYLILMAMRLVLTLAFRPLFKAVKGDLTFRDCFFITVAGLRGSASLIMGQAVVTESAMYQADQQIVRSEIVFWTAGFVLLTLLINAPLLPLVLRATGLSAIPEKQLARRKRAVQALSEHTGAIIEQLRGEEDEMMTGVDWAHVARYCDVTRKLTSFSEGQAVIKPTKRGDQQAAPWRVPRNVNELRVALAACLCCCCFSDRSGPGGREDRSLLATWRGLLGQASATIQRTLGRLAGRGSAVGPTAGDPHGDGLQMAGRGGSKAEPGGAASPTGVSRLASLGAWRPGGARQPPTIEEHHEEGFAHDSHNGSHDFDDEGRSHSFLAAGGSEGLARSSVPHGLLYDMLPVLAESQLGHIDVLQQECPLAGKTRFGEKRDERKAQGQDDHSRHQGAPAGRGLASPGGSRVAGPGDVQASKEQQARRADVAAGDGDMAGDAYSAALLARSARTKQHPQQPAGQPSPPRRGVRLRSLATRSASPYFASGLAAPESAPVEGAAPPANSTEDGSSARGPALAPPPSGGPGPLWARLGKANAPLPSGSASGRPPSKPSAAPPSSGVLPSDPMTRALGRPSRSLAARSVTLQGAYGGGDGDSPSAPPRGSPPSSSAGAASESARRPFGYSLQAAGRSDPNIAAAAQDGPRDRPLSTRSIGAGGPQPDGPSTRPLPSLSKMSTNAGPHMAPIAPALGRISTGLAAAYGPGGTGGAAVGPTRDLRTHSMPISHLARGSRPFPGDRSTGAPSSGGVLPPGAPSSVLGRTSWGAESATLGKPSVGAPSSAGAEASQEALADARTWLVSGLKRYFHGKRMQGLLSARGMRILDYGCDTLLDDPYRPLELWDVIERDATSTWVVNIATSGLFAIRRTSVWLMHPRLGRFGRVLGAPLRLVASTLQRPLNKILLLGVEVAMEYLLGLTSSPYIQWLQASDVWPEMLGEITSETAAVWQWLMDREVEAPERYSAVQSYRAAMAVLRQQQHFLEDLFESGMIDDMERSVMIQPIDAQERALELTGPVWRAPGIKAILSQLPFLSGQPHAVRDFMVKYGHLVMLTSGATLPEDDRLFVVTSGILAVSYSPELGETQEYYLGAGGVYNLYTALTGETLPGSCKVSARGNALGKGPVLFCFTGEGMKHIKRLAEAGDERFAQLELNMYRLAGILMVERVHQQFEIELTQALTRAAPDYANTEPQLAAAAAADAAGSGAEASPGAVPPAAPTPPAPLQRSTTFASRRVAWARQKVAQVLQVVRRQLGQSELLLLQPGAEVSQHTTVLLLAGSLQCTPDMPGSAGDTGAAAGDSGPQVIRAPSPSDTLRIDAVRWMCSAGRHQGQGLLPSLWEILTPDELAMAPAHVPRQQPRVTLTAGPNGATLLVCPSLRTGTQGPVVGSASPPGPADAAAGPGPFPPRAPSASNLANVLRGGQPAAAPPVPGGSALSLGLMTMMPPLAGINQQLGQVPGAVAGVPPASPAASLTLGVPPPPLAAVPGAVNGGPGMPLGGVMLSGGVGRITEEDMRTSGTGAAPEVVQGAGGAAAPVAAGGSRRVLLKPLHSRHCLTREKHIPFSAGDGAGTK